MNLYQNSKDHLSYETTVLLSLEWSLKTGFTVQGRFKPDHICMYLLRSFSQMVPLNRWGQVQLKELGRSLQVAPFLQGVFQQSFISCEAEIKCKQHINKATSCIRLGSWKKHPVYILTIITETTTKTKVHHQLQTLRRLLQTS